MKEAVKLKKESHQAWLACGTPDELEEVAGEREVCASLLRLLPLQPGLGRAVENG